MSTDYSRNGIAVQLEWRKPSGGNLGSTEIGHRTFFAVDFKGFFFMHKSRYDLIHHQNVTNIYLVFGVVSLCAVGL